jgi:hypothetical protein
LACGVLKFTVHRSKYGLPVLHSLVLNRLPPISLIFESKSSVDEPVTEPEKERTRKYGGGEPG